MAKRISQLTELTTAASDDYLPIVDQSTGQTKRITVQNLTGLPDVGWQASGETWTYSSFSSSTRIGVITVPSDATTKYSAGMKIRISQTTGGTKYGTIVAVTATTISVFFGPSYTLNNETISSPVYSTEYMPVGYAGPLLSYEGYQDNITNSQRWVWVVHGWGVVTIGVATAASETVTLPITCAAACIPVGVFGGDNGADSTTYGQGGDNVHGAVCFKVYSPTTTSFIVKINQAAGSNWGTGDTGFYQWVARCPVT